MNPDETTGEEILNQLLGVQSGDINSLPHPDPEPEPEPEDPPFYKVTGPNGEAIHGGAFSYVLPTNERPGAWTPLLERVAICDSGYHVTTDPYAWYDVGARVFTVETGGKRANGFASEADHKAAFGTIRLTREVTSAFFGEFADAEAFVLALRDGDRTGGLALDVPNYGLSTLPDVDSYRTVIDLYYALEAPIGPEERSVRGLSRRLNEWLYADPDGSKGRNRARRILLHEAETAAHQAHFREIFARIGTHYYLENQTGAIARLKVATMLFPNFFGSYDRCFIDEVFANSATLPGPLFTVGEGRFYTIAVPEAGAAEAPEDADLPF